MARSIAALVLALLAACARSEPVEPLYSLAGKERAAVVDTLRTLVEVESASRDLEGLERLAGLIAQRLTALGAQVETYRPSPGETVRLFDTPERVGPVVIGRLHGSGSRRVMLLAHMDTVYPRGTLATRPFRMDADRLYGPGIADAKGGVAVILHAVSLLNAMEFRDFGTLTVVINGDEEISSPGSRALIERLGGAHDVVLSCEPPLGGADQIALATSGIGLATLTVTGKPAHAGVNPEQGRNAIVELAHRLLQTADLSDRERRVKFNWTLASGGQVRNMIPDRASATADVRANRLADLDWIERRLRERIASQPPLVAGTIVDVKFETRRAPLEASAASWALARTAQSIYAEIDRTLIVDDSGTGGGTDAAFAAASGRPAVTESFGLIGAGFHSSGDEYVELGSIAPRLYLLTRLIVEATRSADW